MSVYYYANSSQVALRGDRVESEAGLRGELRGLWLDNGAAERNKLQAEVAWDLGATTSVPLRTLVYIPPEREAAERLAAEMAETERLANGLAEALGPNHTAVVQIGSYDVRADALNAAVAYARADNRIASPHDVVKVAEIFAAYLWPSGQAPADGPVDG